MRVGLVIYGDLDTVSGGYLYDRMLVAALRAYGDEVEIVSLPWRNYARHLADNVSPPVYRRLREGEWDVLLQDELNHPSLFLLNTRLGQPRRWPVVAIVHHLRSSERRPAWQNRLYRWVERRYLGTVDGFVFNSMTTRAEVARLVGRVPLGVVAPPGRDHRPAGGTHALAQGAAASDLDGRRTLAQDRPTSMLAEQVVQRAFAPGPLRVLFIGNLIPRKGLHTVLEALARLPAEACRLTVAGSERADPAYAAALRARIVRLGLSGRVELLGAVQDEALNRLLAESHVLAVPSSYEGYGIVYAEALGHGLPVIASTVGAAHEIITDGREGYLVAPEDGAAVAAILGRLNSDRAQLAAMAQAALARFAGLPTWAESTAAIRGFLLSLVYAPIR